MEVSDFFFEKEVSDLVGTITKTILEIFEFKV